MDDPDLKKIEVDRVLIGKLLAMDANEREGFLQAVAWCEVNYGYILHDSSGELRDPLFPSCYLSPNCFQSPES